mmetsp:Transcript_147454/g.260798  ORF Transcript_147454/g.260798 Transcript_147454/m.260798 type:complete len:735 (-) Transcript_147454:47-2251(-)
MDLSHLVTIGLYPAKRAPLKEADYAYFQKHGVDKILADVIDELAQKKPADPYKFIADAVLKLSNGKAPSAAPAPAAAAPKAPPPPLPKKEEKKEKEKKEPAQEKKPKAAAKAKEPAAPAAEISPEAQAKIQVKADEIREAKKKLTDEGLKQKEINEHPEIQKLVTELKAMKAAAEGGAPAAAPAEKPAPKKEAKAKENAAPKKEAKAKAKESKEEKGIQPSKGGGIDVKKAEDVPMWYEQVIKKGELIEGYPVKGCFILRPWAYRIWELIQGWFDGQIKEMGVENCYFPMFIPKCYIEKEEDHLNDFAPELAWVSKFGNQDIDEPVAIRPTSETAMYTAYSNWVQSHRDLPIKLNQWCSVVRWEVKQTTPFLRTREFLWQEGHSAFATKEAAEKEVFDILELYALVYEHLMAIPVVRGTKTKQETFPGADYTTTVEAFIPATGRAIQGATSHHLGQNFSKMFDISFQDPNDKAGKLRANAFQNSWGITQRTLGVMTMVHGDDKGLNIPPRCAPIQVVIVPLGIKANSSEEDKQKLASESMSFYMQLKKAGIRVKLDDRDEYSPGWKFNHWEMKGVPLRIELGPKDIEKSQFVMAKRNILDVKEGKVVGQAAKVVEDVTACLDGIQEELYKGAVAERDARIATISEWNDFSPSLNAGKLVMIPFCLDPACEEMIKAKTKEEAADVEVAGGLKMGAKSLCIPHEEKWHAGCPSVCINPDCPSGLAVHKRVLFGRSY